MKKESIIKIFLIFALICMLSSNNSFGLGKNLVNAFYNYNNNNYLDSIITTTFNKVVSLTTFSGPDKAYDVIHNSILSATESFYLEIYTLSKLQLINDLIAINSSGVEVIVLLSHTRLNPYENDATKEAAYRLNDAGIEVFWTSPTFTYTHAKFWMIDHQTVGIYSGNFAPSSVPDNPSKGNREFGVIIHDTEITAFYETVFFDDLLISSPTVGINTGYLAPEPTTGSYSTTFPTASFNELMEITPVFSPDNSYPIISNMIETATNSIDVELQYINFMFPYNFFIVKDPEGNIIEIADA